MESEAAAFLPGFSDHGSLVVLAGVLLVLAALVIVRRLHARQVGKPSPATANSPRSDEGLHPGDILSELTGLKAAVNDLTMSIHSNGEHIAELRAQVDRLAGKTTNDWSWTLTLKAEPDELESGLDPLVAELRSVVARHYGGRENRSG